MIEELRDGDPRLDQALADFHDQFGFKIHEILSREMWLAVWHEDRAVFAVTDSGRAALALVSGDPNAPQDPTTGHSILWKL